MMGGSKKYIYEGVLGWVACVGVVAGLVVVGMTAGSSAGYMGSTTESILIEFTKASLAYGAVFVVSYFIGGRLKSLHAKEASGQ